MLERIGSGWARVMPSASRARSRRVSDLLDVLKGR